MTLITKRGNGRLNLDNSPYRLNDFDHIDALNITRDSRADGQDEVVANINGNTLSNYSLPSGVNKVIGNKPDLVRNRVYFFVWNSNDYHSILFYDGVDGIVKRVFTNKTDTYLNENILNFNPSYRINHIDIIYRDEGDLIYWTDGLNSPRCIDVTYIKSFLTSSIKPTDIEMAKQPPSIPPFCWYVDDNTVTVNNLRKSLFKFKLRYVYNDLTKSTTSSQGAFPLPISENVLTDPPNKNAKISIAFTTGEKNVSKIEILASNSLGNVFSDYYLIKSIDKAELGLADNVVATYNFFNNEAYNNIDVNESILLFSYIPQKSATQASANGNTIEYANILEGYDNPSVGSSAITKTNTVTIETYEQGSVYVYQNGDSTNTLSSYNIQIIALGNFGINTTLDVVTTSGTLAYTSSADETASTFLTNFAALAATNGYTTSIVGGILTINKVNEVLIKWLYVPVNDTAAADFKSSMPVYDWWTRYSFGLVWFDKKGKTNGVVFPLNNSIQTSGYSVANLIGSDYIAQMEYVAASVNQTTPTWAYSYQIVRSARLNKGYFIQWISDITIKEISGGTLNQSYAYIGINSLDGFIAENPASNFLAYSFVVKDRIRFIANGMQSNGSATNIYTDKDFEIIDYVANPTINGVVYTGKYIKIILPTTSGSFDFGTSTFFNYFLEVYRPTVPASSGLDIYYEFGLQRLCRPNTAINVGLISYQGDCYGRYREINTVPLIKYIFDALPATSALPQGQLTIGVTNKSISFSSNSYYPTNETWGQPFPPSSTQILNITDNAAHTFRLKGSIELNINSNVGLVYFKVKALDGSSEVAVQTLFSTATFSGYKTFDFDVTIVCPIGTKQLVICYEYGTFGFPFNMEIKKGYFTLLETVNIYRQFCIDPNFSDYYQSAVNSNGRSFIYDENAKQQWFPTTIRFGGEFQQNTNINKTNIFYPESIDDYDRSNGSIQKLFLEGRRLFVFQQFDIGVVPVLQQIVKTASGDSLLTQNDTLLNKIQYPYQGKVGIGNVPESFAYHEYAKYGISDVKGVVWRLSQDGILEISSIYECDAFFSANLPSYDSTLNNGYGASGQPYLGNPTVYGGFDTYTNKYVIALEEINRYNVGGTLIFHQDAYTIIFNESRDEKQGFECFASYLPENIGCLGTLLYTFKNGKIWLHDSSTFNNFYGVQYDSYITMVFKGSDVLKKQWASISQQASSVWDCPIIYTQADSYSNQKQESNLVESDFEYLETSYETSFLRDSKSQGGIIDGDKLKGIYIVIKFRKQNATTYQFLNEVCVSFVNSPLTTH